VQVIRSRVFFKRRAVQFTGRENDATGLHYYRARYYSPTFQRFVAQDPIGFNGGDVDLYSYVRDEPVNGRDPGGRGPNLAIAVGAACAAFDVYAIGSLLSEEHQLYQQIEAIQQQIDELRKRANSCPDPLNQRPEKQIQNLQKRQLQLAGQFAATYSEMWITGIATTAACLGLTAGATLVPPL